MASRSTICFLFAISIGLSGTAWAQSIPFWQNEGGSAQQGYPSSNPYYGAPQYGAPHSGFAPMAYSPDGQPYSQGEQYVMPYADPHYLEYTAPQHEPLWNPNRPIEAVLTRMFSESWMRLEYINWSQTGPRGPLGSATQFSNDPYRFNPVFDGGSNLIGFAKLMNLDGIDTQNNQGLRGTYGTETTFGGFEFNFWGIEKVTRSVVADFLPDSTIFDPFNNNILFPPVPFFVATTTNLNGALSNNAFLWDLAYRADYTTDYWGSEVKFLFDEGEWGEYAHFQTLFGFQYAYAHDHLRQVGISSAGNTGVIASDAENRIFGPTVGFRYEFRHENLTFGVEPKVAISWNDYKGVVTTSQLRSIADPDTYSEGGSTKFAPMMQLAVYARWRLNDHFNFYISFDGTWLTNVARSYSTINYNDNGNANPPAIGYRDSLESMFLHGITGGGEIVLW